MYNELSKPDRGEEQRKTLAERKGKPGRDTQQRVAGERFRVTRQGKRPGDTGKHPKKSLVCR